MPKNKKKTIVLLVLSFFVISGCGQKDLQLTYDIDTSKNSEVPAVNEDVVEKEVEEENLINIEKSYYLPIFALHHVDTPPANISSGAKTWYISEAKFEELLQKIDEYEYKDLFMSEVIDYWEKGKIQEKPIVLTFDDGAIDFYTKAFPLLKKYNKKAVVNIMTGVGGKNWLNDDRIKELEQSGLVEFGSHTRYHVYLTRIAQKEASDELIFSKSALEEILENPVDVIAYPFGLYDEQIIKKAEESGYKAGLTIVSGSTQYLDKPYELKRIIITEHTKLDNLFIK